MANTNAIANVLSKTINGLTDTLVKNVTSLVTQCANQYGGNEIPAKDLTAICNQVSEAQGWEGRTATSRKSEIKAMLVAYPWLESGVAKYVKQTGSIGYTKTVQLARKLMLFESVGDAVTDVIEGSKPASVTPVKAFGRALGMLKNVSGVPSKYVAFRKELATLCAKHGIKY